MSVPVFLFSVVIIFIKVLWFDQFRFLRPPSIFWQQTMEHVCYKYLLFTYL